ncbi:hypothetical protein Nlim_0734 [Candidatus Nitrosarchaeum limnium SFB1]|jgi:hypothetical protein|uniref:Roadblock/LAMTOR2 domain-containing protein n=1 Tax=Candidatus Nitrosarchaeum limnium SFB1 TaxID=886738 RepID=F3KJS6_9ARCH|nr:hypothetical protein Nlim_0734 [Candidatus Nitrosarchaeum limnium SFB1]
MPKINIKEYESRCKEMLTDPEVRFAALLGADGELLAGGLKENINLRLNDAQMDEVCKELASRVEKRKKYDLELGRVKYSTSRREHVVIMSFPVYEKVVMIVAEPNVNIDRLAYRIIEKLGKEWDEFFGKPI